MQRSIRDLAEELMDAGFSARPGKGSHRVFSRGRVTISLPMNRPSRDGRGLVQRVEKALRGEL